MKKKELRETASVQVRIYPSDYEVLKAAADAKYTIIATVLHNLLKGEDLFLDDV